MATLPPKIPNSKSVFRSFRTYLLWVKYALWSVRREITFQWRRFNPPHMYIVHMYVPQSGSRTIQDFEFVAFAKFYFSDVFVELRLYFKAMYGVRNLEKTIRFSLKSRPSEWFHWPEMSQIKGEISLCTDVEFHKNVGLKWYQWIWFL